MYFVDSGSSSDVDSVRKIKQGSSLSSQPPACMRCGLYGVKTSNDIWEEACSGFYQKTSKGTVEGTIETVVQDRNPEPGQQGEIKKVVLYGSAGASGALVMGGNKCSLNEQLLKESLVRLTRKETSFTALSRVDYKDWVKEEGIAKRSRSKLWKHGTPDSDDDEF